MKFAHFSHVWNKPGMTAAQRYAQLWRELALCDELGYDFGFCVEHHFNPRESWMPTPSIYCAGAAAHTRRLRLGPMGYIVPLYDPLRILEEAAVLDNVLDGRFELGLISGITPLYFRHYEADFENRRALANEAVTLVETAFAGDEPFSFDGPFHHYQDVQLSVLPLQRPHPPLWVQSRDHDTLELLARVGANTGYLFFLPRDDAVPRYREYLRRWQEAGHPHKPNISYWTLVYVGETDEAAVAQATPHIVHAFSRVFGSIGSGTTQSLANNFRRRGEHSAAEIAERLTDVDYLLSRNLVFVGSAETVARRIREAASDGLFNTVCCEFNFGTMDENDLMESMRRFGTQVLPVLRDYEPY